MNKVHPGLELASLTDVGCQRDNNEDSYAYWKPEDEALLQRAGCLAIIADGMGGCEGGQHASRIAVETVKNFYSESNLEDPQQRLNGAFAEAHRQVRLKAEQVPILRGMGTTLTAFAVVNERLYYAHVGDSRLYLLKRGTLTQLTHDHSLVAQLVANGMVAPEEAENHPQKHVLTAAIGVSERSQPDAPSEPLPLASSDVLLLCTDGLWGQVTEKEIASILGSNSPMDACQALVDLAKQRGGPDNITLQIATVQ